MYYLILPIANITAPPSQNEPVAPLGRLITKGGDKTSYIIRLDLIKYAMGMKHLAVYLLFLS